MPEHVLSPEKQSAEKPFPWRCPKCRQLTVTRVTMPYLCQRTYDGRVLTVEVPNLAVPHCSNCGEVVFDYAADEQIRAAFRKLSMDNHVRACYTNGESDPSQEVSATPQDKQAPMSISELWCSTDPRAWSRALECYWQFVKPTNLELERALDQLDLARIRELDAQGWYEFLRDEYFRWKFTAPNRYATTTLHLGKHLQSGSLDDLYQIRDRLLTLKLGNIREALTTARQIKGLGVAGASGLLALMYPAAFGTADQFVVKALRDVEGLPEAEALGRMNPERLTTSDGVLLIQIMQRKADENNRLFQTTEWTPRKIDKILWTYGRQTGRNSCSCER
jgi:hypothetical protein